MQTELSRELGIDYPIFGFSYVPEVAGAISRAGGFGVLGAVRYGGEATELDEALEVVEAEADGRPYGVNLVMPVSRAQVEAGGFDDLEEKLAALIPEEHREFVERFLTDHDVPPLPEDGEEVRGVLGWADAAHEPQLDVAFRHSPALLASALGPPSKEVVDRAHEAGIKVAALVGRVDQALKQREQGVDIIVAQGWEAGGHTGDIASMVLWPEVVDAVAPAPVLAAGGVGSGRQVAAALALGTQGAWTGSIWLSTTECALPDGLQKLLWEATSRDTVRSRGLTGKPARQLKTPWLEAWGSDENPDPLQMPLQYLLTSEALARFRAAGRHDLVGTPVGQIVGALHEARPVVEVMADLVDGARKAAGRVHDIVAGG
jgi:NAD(P)H-dependent flavin oxidoreductase YrpB (nitropropane dioxygenase family)